MIVRGTNLPILLTFQDSDPSTFQSLSVMMYPREGSSANAIKTWDLDDVTIEGEEVQCPLDQEDTLELQMTEDMNVTIEVKWLTAEDTVENAVLFHTYISYRKDTTILGGA